MAMALGRAPELGWWRVQTRAAANGTDLRGARSILGGGMESRLGTVALKTVSSD
jgi:hypothetical protein